MMKQWLILVASLLPLSSGEMEDLGRCRDLEGMENSSRCVHQYDDYSAPDFDWSRLKVLFSGIGEVPDCPQEHQKLTVFEYIYEDELGNVTKTNLTHVFWEHKVTEFRFNGTEDPFTLIIRPNLNCMDQDDPELVEVIKSLYMIPPPTSPKYNLSTTFDSSHGWWGDGQARTLDQIFFHEQKKGGFFVEAGAFDGATDSTSLHFEIAHQWSGLLIEPVASLHAKIADKGRRAWSVNTCISTITKPQTINWSDDFNDLTVQGIADERVNGSKTMKMQCFPFYTLLLAIGNPTIDFLSLDIEGPELEVLQTIPWTKVDIRAISVETEHISVEKRDKLFHLLTSNGFTHLTPVARDDLFVRLPERGESPKQKGTEVLMRQIPRLCQYFRVKRSDLFAHCRNTNPRDYFMSTHGSSLAPTIQRPTHILPECLFEDQCRNNVTGERNHMPWKTQLNDGCMVITSEGWSGEPEGEFDPMSKARLFQPLLKAMGSL